MAEPKPTGVDAGYAWVVVAVSLAIHTIGLGPASVLFVSLKPIAAEFDWPRTVPSMAYALMMFGSGVGGIVMGLWMDRHGILYPVLFGSVAIGVGALLAGQADSRFDLYVANGLLIGLCGKSAIIAPLIANATRWFDRRRGMAVAIVASAQGLAGAFWPQIVQWTYANYGWRETYTYFGWFALLTMVPLSLALYRKPPAQTQKASVAADGSSGRIAALSPRATQALLWVAVLGCCTGMSMPLVHLISHATDLGHSPTHAAQILSGLFVSAFVSRLLFGWLADRIGALPTILIGSVGQGATLLLLATVTSLPGLYIAGALFGLGFSGIMPCYSLIVRMLFPVAEGGWRIASQYLFGATGMAFGGWLGGAVFDLGGSYVPAFLVGFGFNVVHFLVLAFMYLRYVPHVDTRSPALA